MSKTWTPTAAGILIIVSGTLQVAFAIPALLNFVLGMGKRYGVALAVAGELAIIFVPLALSGTLGIVGGIYALKRRKLDCTPMIGQVGLGESGGVSDRFADSALPPQIHQVAGNQGLNEVSFDYRPLR